MSDPATERPKARTITPLRALLPLLRPHAGVLVAALTALLVAAAAQLALPIALRFLIDEGLIVRDTQTINRYFIAFAGAAMLFGAFSALRYYLITRLGERVVADLRRDVYDRVIRMDPGFFEITRTGEVLSRLTADTTLVQSIAGVGISITLRSAVTLLGSLVLLVATSPMLTGLIVLLLPAVVVPLIWLGRRLRRLSRDSQDRIADASALAGETINAISTVQAFTLEALISGRFAEAVEGSYRAAQFSLTIEPGETVAFVGPSGAGKSTVFNLLLRYYDPSAGRIVIDGVDIARAAPDEVRRRIGLVPQETVLFGATARENIRFGRPEATDDEIADAAQAAAADEFIRALPEGYDTFLGERGTRLSGGQRQRIAIARAVLKDPPILLLDEATSALDAESEQLVQQALERLMRGRTTIVIAHRLATVRQADRIVVMNEGRIEAIGPHTELVELNALYARLAALQLG